MDSWGMGDTGRLIGSSYGWMITVTTPASAVAATTLVAITSGTLPDLMSFVWFTSLFMFATLVLALAGALISVPFTYLLGRALDRVRSRGIHTATHSVLAGVLAAGASSLTTSLWLNNLLPSIAITIAVAAGAAAAIATWRQLRPAPVVAVVAVVPGDEQHDETQRVDAQRSL